MTTVLLIIHVIICIILIVTILLQASKGGGLAGAFGGAGGGGGAMFGGAGAATFLSKVTTYLAIAFFLTCVALWHTSRSGDTLPETAAERMMQQRGPTPLQQAQPQPVPLQSTTQEGAATTPATTDSSK
jgi:preprotein translocase subunit SecG